MIPYDYWLKSLKTRSLHACMVHQMNKEIRVFVSGLSSGQTSNMQCKNTVERVCKERKVAQKIWKISDAVQDNDAHKHISTKIGEMSLLKSQNDLVLSQLNIQ
jgi:hypothetical protein